MTELSSLALAWLGGLLLGASFFSCLWWTIRRGLASPRPALWFAGGLLVRMGVAFGGFWWVARGDFGRLSACLFGFIMVRWTARWLARAPHAPATGGSHAT